MHQKIAKIYSLVADVKPGSANGRLIWRIPRISRAIVAVSTIYHPRLPAICVIFIVPLAHETALNSALKNPAMPGFRCEMCSLES